MRGDPGRRFWVAAVAGAVALAIGLVALIVLLVSEGQAPRQQSSTQSSLPTTTIPTTLTPARPAPSGEAFGVNVNRLFNDGTYTPAQIDAQLQALRDTGATLARSDALWEASEPMAPVDGVHHYDWAFDDGSADHPRPRRTRSAPVDHSPATAWRVGIRAGIFWNMPSSERL